MKKDGILLDVLLINKNPLKLHILLLPHFNDERWLDLLREESVYEESCSIFKQKYFGSWNIEMDKLKELSINQTIAQSL